MITCNSKGVNFRISASVLLKGVTDACGTANLLSQKIGGEEEPVFTVYKSLEQPKKLIGIGSST